MSGSMTQRLRRWAAAAACAVSALGVGGAQAAVFVTNWDPIFNTSFSGFIGQNIGWLGTASVDVDEACLPTFPFAPVTTVVFPDGCGTATLLSYGVTFYDTIPANVISGQGGAGPGLPDPDPGVVQFLYPVISGIDLSGPITLLQETFGGYTWDVELDFVLAGPTLKLTYFSGPTACGGLGEPDCVYDSATVGPNAPVVTWRIPEPSTVLLLCGGLLAALGPRRRNRNGRGL